MTEQRTIEQVEAKIESYELRIYYLNKERDDIGAKIATLRAELAALKAKEAQNG